MYQVVLPGVPDAPSSDPPAGRTGIPAGLRFEVLKRDGFRCQYCGAAAPHALLEVDHVIPVAAGGTNDPLNLRTCCSRCNRGKGTRKLTELSLVADASPQLALDLRRV